MLHMMEALEGVSLGDILGDGAYGTIDCRQAIHDRGGRQVIPPDKNAKLQKGKPFLCLGERDEAIRRTQNLGEERSGTVEAGSWVPPKISKRDVNVWVQNDLGRSFGLQRTHKEGGGSGFKILA